MIEFALPAAVLLASLALTYFFCLRPMRRGQCATAPKAETKSDASSTDEVERLREEIAALRAGNLTPTPYTSS